MARVAHAMAMENPNIAADVVEVQEFPQISRMYMVTGVPKTVINNKVQFVGAVPEATFADKVLEALGLTPEERGGPSLVSPQELGPSTRRSS